MEPTNLPPLKIFEKINGKVSRYFHPLDEGYERAINFCRKEIENESNPTEQYKMVLGHALVLDRFFDENCDLSEFITMIKGTTEDVVYN